jgi:Xaa-Pro dipeptidase
MTERSVESGPMHHQTPREELDRRIRTLQERMSAEAIDAALIAQNADLFYFTGTVQQGCLFLPCEGKPLYFVRKNPERARQESPLDDIIALPAPRDILKYLADLSHHPIRRLGMELEVLPVNHYHRYLHLLEPREAVDLSPAIQAVRTVKSAYELNLMKGSAKLSDLIVETARYHLREGISDLELAASVEKVARIRGHQGLVRTRGFNQEVYWGHLFSGPDAAIMAFVDSPTGGTGLNHAFPHGTGWRVIGRHEPVIVDLVAVKNGYHIDQTRTLSVGPLPDKLEKACHVSIDIIRQVEQITKPGILSGDLYAKARKIAEQHHLLDHFMGYGHQRAAFCGHGIGIELDELPVIIEGGRAPLAAGTVFALEPKFNFPGEGVVGVEDTLVVTETGCERLTRASYDIDVTAG